ncbi:MAG: hypothetical protein JW699_03710 [Chitinispirillaceae bacterium]|nr:hypothetical protein [Chitinispirillaceae bacterium]
MKKSLRAAAAAIAGMAVCAGLSNGETTVKLTPTGFASYEVGQIVDYNPLTVPSIEYRPAHLMYQKSYVGFNVQSLYDPLPITTNLGVELKSFTETPRKRVVAGDAGVGVRFFYFFYLTRVDLVYSPSEAFNLQIGYFPVKYNDDVRNLGEYLFRSGAYPQYLNTNFDFAAARVTGLNAYGTLFGALKYNALLTVTTENATMGDLNFTGIASYSFLDKFFELGGGFSFCSFISADPNHTHPPKEDAFNDRARYIKNGDTAVYTFAGTKLMGRLSIDPKALFKSDLFGKEDLKIYAEAAVLGLKNYPVSVDTSSLGTRYDDILKRMPVMFGFNWPTHPLLVSIAPGLAELFIEREFDLSTILTGGGGLLAGGSLWLLERYTETKLRLDALNIEMEWFGSHYPNDMKNFVYFGVPAAYSQMWDDGGGNSMYADSVRDNWKWSIYAKKTFAGHFFAVFQVASDHFRWDRFNYSDQAAIMTEALTQRKHKYWVMKLGYSF